MAIERRVFTGRTDELAALDEWVGVPCLVLVRGARGSGRTALLQQVERLWRARGVTVNPPRLTPAAAVLVDDAPDLVPVIAAAYRAGCTVVATCGQNAPAALMSLADKVIDLGPLPDRVIDDLLARIAPTPLDDAVAPAVRAALGPFAGNPGTVLATVAALHRDDRFVDVLGRLCLRDPAAIALPAGHVLVPELGDIGVQLVSVVAATDRFGVDDLLDFADALGHYLDLCGDAVDRLVAAGALVCDRTGRLRVSCPALAAAAVRDDAVHRALAEHLLRNGTADTAVVADHVALAGETMPADPALGVLLEREATRVARANQPLAARWFRAALRHTEPGAGRVRLLRIVLHLLLRTAQHAELAEVVTTEVAAGADPSCHYELAAAAALAFVHIGRPVPASVCQALEGDPRARVALRLADRWFDGQDAPRAVDVAAAFSGFRVNRVLDWEQDASGVADVAGDQYDVVAMLELVLGPCYGEPGSGPLADYRRLVREYVGGDWSRVGSSARSLELASAPAAVHHVSRLLAAEVHSASGELDQARRWLDLAGADGPFPALRMWVEVGLTFRSGDRQGAVERGWSAYEQIRAHGDITGLPWLLLRLGVYEKALGNAARLARAAFEAEYWHECAGGPNLHTTELLLRAVSEDDLVAAVAAVDLLRGNGSVADLTLACLVVATLCDDPAPWFREVFQLARRLGHDRIEQRVREEMQRAGVSAPRGRAAHSEFSDVELRIIALVGEGRTNRQIASAVRMSEKTVEGYLSRLFARTGCRSRLDLAAAAIEGRLAARS